MYTPTGLLIQLAIFIVIVAFLIVLIYKSNLTKDRKLAASIVTAINPVLGLIVFFILRRKTA